jgi:putative endonuclease
MRSKKNGKRYIGSTSKLPEDRIKDHNNGSNKFTRHNRPWNLLASEEFLTKNEALKREKFLKSGQGRKWLDDHNDRA